MSLQQSTFFTTFVTDYITDVLMLCYLLQLFGERTLYTWRSVHCTNTFYQSYCNADSHAVGAAQSLSTRWGAGLTKLPS